MAEQCVRACMYVIYVQVSWTMFLIKIMDVLRYTKSARFIELYTFAQHIYICAYIYGIRQILLSGDLQYFHHIRETLMGIAF